MSTAKAVNDAFSEDTGLADDQVLFFNYTYANWEGSAYGLFVIDGKLFEVHGSHCSCYGLEGQWNPELTTKEAVLNQLSNKSLWGVMADNKAEIRAIVEGLVV